MAWPRRHDYHQVRFVKSNRVPASATIPDPRLRHSQSLFRQPSASNVVGCYVAVDLNRTGWCLVSVQATFKQSQITGGPDEPCSNYTTHLSVGCVSQSKHQRLHLAGYQSRGSMIWRGTLEATPSSDSAQPHPRHVSLPLAGVTP